MNRRLYMRIAYDGTNFHGWQIQPGVRTVQRLLEEAARRVLRHPLEIVGSGRTDAGVHAIGQVAHVTTTCEIPAERLPHALGSRLPDDVAISEVRDVHPDFHAIRSATSKLYRYRIFNSPLRPVTRLAQRYTHHQYVPLDVDRMSEAAKLFVGTRDFAAMAKLAHLKENTVRTVLRCDVERDEDEIRIDVEGTGFLYNQVRNMVGTLIEVGRGRWEPQRVADILVSGDRGQAGPTAPALGLCLQWVRYPGELLVPPAQMESTGNATNPAAVEESR